MRTRFVFGDDKKLYQEGHFPPGVEPLNKKPTTYGRSAMVLEDYKSFVSPLDGTVVSGRKAYRQHCQDHGVVPTRELEGLPPKHAVEEYKPDRAAIREELVRQVYNK
jgi:hypothetical protein